MRFALFLVLAGMALVAAAVRAGDGVVALQTAEPSCRTTTTPPPRYVDCGNGTVTDNETGLVWLKNASCFGTVTWWEARDTVAGLSDLLDRAVCPVALTADECDCGLSDGSSPGEWRLPSASEWDSMVSPEGNLQCTDPVITNDAGDGCWDQDCVDLGNCSFYSVQSAGYWSSSPDVFDYNYAKLLSLDGGVFRSEHKARFSFVWPVRGGQ